jgi:hypothetical protein
MIAFNWLVVMISLDSLISYIISFFTLFIGGGDSERIVHQVECDELLGTQLRVWVKLL